jgi:hypothetical protein
VRLSWREAGLVYGALTEWKAYLDAGGWDETDAEARQLADATAAVEVFDRRWYPSRPRRRCSRCCGRSGT